MAVRDAAKPCSVPRRSLRLLGVVSLVSALSWLPVAAEPSGQEAGRSRIDLTEPSQEAFRGWPGPELLERPYWLPWGQVAFNRAILFDRPVMFVLTVPWSAPAREMTEGPLADPRVLRHLNENWLCILVDADTRPDLRERYQTGTWPVITFLLPDGMPMISTANPQEVAMPITINRVDSDAMLFLLEQGRIYFDRWRQLLGAMGDEWVEREGPNDPVPGPVNSEASDAYTRYLLGNADRTDGGFGAAPKFLVSGLTRYAVLRDARLQPALEPVAFFTLTRLVESPLYDTEAGGMHRMATRPGWQGIQWEKMLDRNAALLDELATALRYGGDAGLEEPLRGTAGFLIDTLAADGGGFFLAENAAADPDAGTRTSGIDRLILAGPNLQAAAALVNAGTWLGDAGLIERGVSTADWVLDRAYLPGRGLDHGVGPEPRGGRFLVTQADGALALCELYELTGYRRFLDAAQGLVEFSLANLGADTTLLADHLSTAAPIGLLGNPRYPMRANARMARAMTRLSYHVPATSYRQRAREMLGAFAGDLSGYLVHGVEAALALEELIEPPLLIGLPAGADPALRRAAINQPWPWTVILTTEEPVAWVRHEGQQREVQDVAALLAAARELTGVAP